MCVSATTTPSPLLPFVTQHGQMGCMTFIIGLVIFFLLRKRARLAVTQIARESS